MDRYVIRGGDKGYERLQVLARDRWPDTHALLERAGLRVGMHCVDLGCGSGDVSLGIAELVAPGGRVVGVDMDEIKLGLARKAAASRGVSNVEFRAANLTTWDEPEAYDLVFTRFVLHHLRHPVEMLRHMWAAVRPGGVLVVEDADFDGWCCHPPNQGFDFFLDAYSRAVAHWGGDHAQGRKLYHYCLDAGVPDPQVSVIQPLRLQGEAKALPWSTLEASKDAILDAGIASAAEIDEALERLAELANDPHSLISGPRIFQVWAGHG